MATRYKTVEAAQLVPLESLNPTESVRLKRKYDFLPLLLTQEKPPKKHHKKWVVEMKEAMETDRAKELYKKRKTTVEPVFGIIKGVLGFRAPCALWRS